MKTKRMLFYHHRVPIIGKSCFVQLWRELQTNYDLSVLVHSTRPLVNNRTKDGNLEAQ